MKLSFHSCHPWSCHQQNYLSSAQPPVGGPVVGETFKEETILKMDSLTAGGIVWNAKISEM